MKNFNITFLSTAPYNDASRVIAHGIKDDDASAIQIAAEAMAKILPENTVLIPAPSHKGNAIQTLHLAEQIAALTGAEVYDILRGKARQSNYEAKKQGHPLNVNDLAIYRCGDLPTDRTPVIIDNVADTLVTAKACANVIGNCIVLTYART